MWYRYYYETPGGSLNKALAKNIDVFLIFFEKAMEITA